MDVLELPRPVINFLRTMAKESCRYVLSWDIFGGTDTLTLTLTWKLINDDTQSSIQRNSQIQINDDLHIRNIDLISPPRCSRRDENSSTSAMFRASRGKSLEGNNPISNKQIACSETQVSSLERLSIIHQQEKEESDPIYSNLCHVKYARNPSPSSLLDKNPPLSVAHTHHRRSNPPYEYSILRKVVPSIPSVSNTFSKVIRKNHVATRNNNNNDDTLNPWVQRLESSLEDNTNETIEKPKNNINETGIISNRVKFKKKPDYF
jgi:hypothetical protein